MSKPEITDDIRQFIFEHVDSVAQLDLLLFMRETPEVAYSAEVLGRELRTSTSAAEGCLALLNRSGLLTGGAGVDVYHYAPSTPEAADLITRLAAVYKIKPHKVLELIFSSAKRARSFADAFALMKPSKPEDDNG